MHVLEFQFYSSDMPALVKSTVSNSCSNEINICPHMLHEIQLVWVPAPQSRTKWHQLSMSCHLHCSCILFPLQHSFMPQSGLYMHQRANCPFNMGPIYAYRQWDLSAAWVTWNIPIIIIIIIIGPRDCHMHTHNVTTSCPSTSPLV